MEEGDRDGITPQRAMRVKVYIQQYEVVVLSSGVVNRRIYVGFWISALPYYVVCRFKS
jgi:hypothetical protein